MPAPIPTQGAAPTPSPAPTPTGGSAPAESTECPPEQLWDGRQCRESVSGGGYGGVVDVFGGGITADAGSVASGGGGYYGMTGRAIPRRFPVANLGRRLR
jgi:hypothetical protein